MISYRVCDNVQELLPHKGYYNFACVATSELVLDTSLDN